MHERNKSTKKVICHYTYAAFTLNHFVVVINVAVVLHEKSNGTDLNCFVESIPLKVVEE